MYVKYNIFVFSKQVADYVLAVALQTSYDIFICHLLHAWVRFVISILQAAVIYIIVWKDKFMQAYKIRIWRCRSHMFF